MTPVAKRPEAARALVASAGLVIATVFVLVRLAVTCGDPRHYYEYRHSPTMPYPTREVITWSLATVLEVGVAIFALMRTRRSVRAACMAIAVGFGIVAFGLLPFLMHAPPYVYMPVAVSVLGGVWLLFVAAAPRAR